MCNRADDPTQHDVPATCGGCGHAAHWRECRGRTVGVIPACACRRRGPSGAPAMPNLTACPQCGALGFILPCSECGYLAINADTEHVCADGTVIADTAAPVASNEHMDAWCAACGERLLLPGFAGGPTLEDKR